MKDIVKKPYEYIQVHIRFWASIHSINLLTVKSPIEVHSSYCITRCAYIVLDPTLDTNDLSEYITPNSGYNENEWAHI